MTNRQKKWLSILALLLFVAFCGTVGYFVGVPMVRLAEDPTQFRHWVDSYGIWGRLVFVGMVVLQVIIAFIPGEPIELAAGYGFGFLEGTLLTLVGFVIGSLIVFLIVRKLGVKLVEVFFDPKRIQEFSFLKDSKKTKTIAFLLMIIPGTPKDFLSYFAGLTSLTLKSWLGIVVVGRLPSLITSTATGAAAGEKNYIVSGIMLLVTLVVTVVGVFYYRRICKSQQENMDK